MVALLTSHHHLVGQDGCRFKSNIHASVALQLNHFGMLFVAHKGHLEQVCTRIDGDRIKTRLVADATLRVRGVDRIGHNNIRTCYLFPTVCIYHNTGDSHLLGECGMQHGEEYRQ